MEAIKQLAKIAQRLENPQPFFESVLTRLCARAIAVLKANSPGDTLPEEWRYTIAVSKTEATAKIYHPRLEADPETWLVVFSAHNDGSEDHWIFPTHAQALSWVGDDGVRHFSKGHEVRGVKARHFGEKCDRVIDEYMATLQAKWTRWIETGRLP